VNVDRLAQSWNAAASREGYVDGTARGQSDR
jgi:hypothetical protein